jgi:GTPase
MLPIVVIVGRPNVGKSTLFNRLTRSRDAIVVDQPGITRDRHYGRGQSGERPYLVVDTGGFEPGASEGIYRAMAGQTRQAVDEADMVLFMLDARTGLTGEDEVIAEELRRSGRRVIVVVNKCEGQKPELAVAEFHALGLGEPLAISAAHGEHVADLIALALAELPAGEEPAPEAGTVPRVAVVGRPNVGKSTLVNALIGEERMIVFDQPGTTRDAIEVDFEWEGRAYRLIDTAGMRRRARMEELAEKFSVVKTMQAIADANVVVLVLDARQDVAEQDAHIAGFILESGRALVVAVNKWDALESAAREAVKRNIERNSPRGRVTVGRSCATPTRGARIPPASSCTAPRSIAFPTVTADIWNDFSGTLSNCRVRRSKWNSGRDAIPTCSVGLGAVRLTLWRIDRKSDTVAFRIKTRARAS